MLGNEGGRVFHQRLVVVGYQLVGIMLNSVRLLAEGRLDGIICSETQKDVL